MSYPHYSADCDQHHDLVRDFGGPRPTIVVLCGSTRFYDTFRAENLRLTLAGKIVLSIGCDTKADGDIAEIGDLGQAKADLDALHQRKIDLADEALVLRALAHRLAPDAAVNILSRSQLVGIVGGWNDHDEDVDADHVIAEMRAAARQAVQA